MCHSSAWSLLPGQDSRGPGEDQAPTLLVLRGGSPESRASPSSVVRLGLVPARPPLAHGHMAGAAREGSTAGPWAADFTPRLWVELCKEGSSALKVPSSHNG